MHSPFDLSNKRVLVTGASSGIGRQCAISLASYGAAVVLIGRDEQRLQSTLQDMHGQGHQAIGFDVTDFDAYQGLFDEITRQGKLSGLVHAAGVCPITLLKVSNPQSIQSSLNVNYVAFMELVRWYCKKKVGMPGAIVGISSVSSLSGWAGASVYCGTKGAMDSSIRALALEMAPRSIRVNSVLPSNIDTPMTEANLALTGSDDSKIKEQQPLGVGTPVDVAHAVLFLLSDAARFITGTQLVVDGGYLSR